MHVRVAWYACMARGARTGHLYAWTTRGARAGHLVHLEDTWCTCGWLVVLVGHVVHVQSEGPLVVTCCTCESLGMLV